MYGLMLPKRYQINSKLQRIAYISPGPHNKRIHQSATSCVIKFGLPQTAFIEFITYLSYPNQATDEMQAIVSASGIFYACISILYQWPNCGSIRQLWRRLFPLVGGHVVHGGSIFHGKRILGSHMSLIMLCCLSWCIEECIWVTSR